MHIHADYIGAYVVNKLIPPPPSITPCAHGAAFDTQETNSISDVYTGTYYMTAHIHITGGATLEIDGNEQDDEFACKILLLVRTFSHVQQIMI